MSGLITATRETLASNEIDQKIFRRKIFNKNFEENAMTIYNWSDDFNVTEFPTILAAGDSWFWYPKNNNLLEALARNGKLKSYYANMVRIGKNGETLANFVDVDGRPGKYSNELNYLLKPLILDGFTVFMVSGAGNDAIDYSLALKSDCTGIIDPAGCFDDDGMHGLLKNISQSIGLLLHEVISAFQRINQQPCIFLHGYDYPVPDGRGFAPLPGITTTGPWLSTAMNNCKVSVDLNFRKAIAKILIDKHASVFQQYQNSTSKIYFIDSRGTLRTDDNYKKDWDNELHPTNSGFNQIVEKKWIPQFQALGFANP